MKDLGVKKVYCPNGIVIAVTPKAHSPNARYVAIGLINLLDTNGDGRFYSEQVRREMSPAGGRMVLVADSPEEE